MALAIILVGNSMMVQPPGAVGAPRLDDAIHPFARAAGTMNMNGG
jgi:hypothetical protein